MSVAADGTRLFDRWWQPAGSPSARVAIVHGLAEHGGRYARLVDALLARGFAVAALDQRGHGRSSGQRGHVASWQDYTDDLHGFLGRVRGPAPALPLFLYGHSMGALVSLDYALRAPTEPGRTNGRHRLAGLILSGVPLQPVGVAKPWLVAIARALSRLLPRAPLSPGIRPEAISRDPDVVRAYAQDPLVHRRATARWGVEALEAIERVRARLPDLRLPLLLIHGGADSLGSPDGSREVFERAGSLDKTLRVYDATYHEPHNDLGWQQVVRDVADWIEARLHGSPE